MRFEKNCRRSQSWCAQRPWGRINTHCSHLKLHFKQNLDQNILINAFLWKKHGYFAAALEDLALNPRWSPVARGSAPPDPQVVTTHSIFMCYF